MGVHMHNCALMKLVYRRLLRGGFGETGHRGGREEGGGGARGML